VTPTTTTDCNGQSLAANPYVVTDLVKGSNFEIDAAVPPPSTAKKGTLPTAGSNQVVDQTGCLDWKGVSGSSNLQQQPDKLNGTGDDAFCRGTSENDTTPQVCTDSIPPNKSDLTGFGTYEETAPTGKFLDLYWSRINNPSGTVTMDFELNKNFCDPTANPTNCDANGETPIRSNGDKLLVYQLDNGGTNATLSEYTWNAANSDWENQTTLSGGSNPLALGSINYDQILTANSITGAQDTLTFGEASVSYQALFSGNACGTFGSVYLKSRSSSTFTDELKDFVKPVKVNISNCATATTSATNATVGTDNTISDTATLSGATNPTGTATFKLYKVATASSTACTSTALVATLTTSTWTAHTTAGVTTYTASVSYPTSGSLGSGDVGTYLWVLFSYTGDLNNSVSGLPSACNDTGEKSTVTLPPSTITTAQSWTPNDTATIDHSGGSVIFSLYKNDSTCTGTPVYGPTSAINVVDTSGVGTGPFTASTSNTTYKVTGVTANSTDTYYWKAAYTSSAGHKDVTENCTEDTTFSALTNGNSTTSS
jgi:hypothetical protein